MCSDKHLVIEYIQSVRILQFSDTHKHAELYQQLHDKLWSHALSSHLVQDRHHLQHILFPAYSTSWLETCHSSTFQATPHPADVTMEDSPSLRCDTIVGMVTEDHGMVQDMVGNTEHIGTVERLDYSLLCYDEARSVQTNGTKKQTLVPITAI